MRAYGFAYGFDWASFDVAPRFLPTKRGEPVPRPTKYSPDEKDE
jgi:hypothetical protein